MLVELMVEWAWGWRMEVGVVARNEGWEEVGRRGWGQEGAFGKMEI